MVLAEFLLQRTRAESVQAAYSNLLKDFPNWESLASADLRTIQRKIRPLGLWRRRSASLQALAKEMARRRGRFPLDRDELETLPGVGQYFGNAIEVICHRRRRAFIDVNLARVVERFFRPRLLADIRYDPYLQELSQRLVNTQEVLRLNWAILDFAAKICTARFPKCDVCPLRKECAYSLSAISGLSHGSIPRVRNA
jgi:A/G-specific adenine glycosylase